MVSIATLQWLEGFIFEEVSYLGVEVSQSQSRYC
jgi:hypothetical protein